MNIPLQSDGISVPAHGNPHVIETLQWACRFADARSAARHQQRLSHFLSTLGAQAINQLFEQLSPPDEIWQIDRLDLDLGALRPDAPLEQWARQLNERLRNELLRLRAEAPSTGSSMSRGAPPWYGGIEIANPAVHALRPASEHSLDHFLYYVEYGHLPWSAGNLAGRDLAGWLEKLAHRDGSRLWMQLQQLPLAEQALQRLSQISPHHGLQALLESRHTGLSTGLTQLDEQVLLPLQTRGRLSAYQLQQLQQTWRIAGLRALWGNNSSVLSADRLRRLLLTFTQSLNHMLGPGWRVFLRPVTQAGLARVPSDVAQLLLHGVLGRLIDDQIPSQQRQGRHAGLPTSPPGFDRKEATPDRAASKEFLENTIHAALARLLALLDRSRDETENTRALSLLKTLSQHCPGELRLHLQSWVRRRARRARWSEQIAPSLLWPILLSLSPEPADAAHSWLSSSQNRAIAAAPWAESLRQFTLNRLCQPDSGHGTISQWQSRLIEYTLRHLALGYSPPRDHHSWQALWQSAWNELTGDETDKSGHGNPFATIASASAPPRSTGGTTDHGAELRDLPDQVRRWLWNPASPESTPWWVEAPAASAGIHAELMNRLRTRSVRAAIAATWPEFRRLQLLHLLTLPCRSEFAVAAPATGSTRTDAVSTRWRWVAEEIGRIIKMGTISLSSAFPNGASTESALVDTISLDRWLWLTAIEWAMQPHAHLSDAAALNDYWWRALLELTTPPENVSASEDGAWRAPQSGETCAFIANDPIQSVNAARIASRECESNHPIGHLRQAASDATNLGFVDGKLVAFGCTHEAVAPPVIRANAAVPLIEDCGPEILNLLQLIRMFDAPLCQWNARLRLQVANLLQNSDARASWLSTQSPAHHRRLLQHQYPRAFPALGDSIDLLLATSRELLPTVDTGKLERDFWRFLVIHLFGEGGSPAPGPLARRFAIHLCRHVHREGTFTETQALADSLKCLDRALTKIAAPSAALQSRCTLVVTAMRQALQSAPTGVEHHELQMAADCHIDDCGGYLGLPVDAGELQRQLDRLLIRPRRKWRAADRLHLMALLDSEEACRVWLDHQDETQRWTLLEQHLVSGAAELRAATERLVDATLILRLSDTIEASRRDCWQFLAHYLFVDGLMAEAGSLARRYAMVLRHRDLDADADRSVSLQRWSKRLADALEPRWHRPDATGRIPSSSSTALIPEHQTELIVAMLEALRKPPTAGEQWEAALTQEARTRLRGDHSQHPSERQAESGSSMRSVSALGGSTTEPWPVRSTAATPLRQCALPGDERSPIYVNNCGLVLLANYTQRLFIALQLLNGSHFKDEAAQWHAIHCLEYLVHGHSESTEPEWVLTKLLCGLPLSRPVPPCEGLEKVCRSTLDGLLQAVIAHWKTIGNTSIAGLRESFLQRPGRLVRRTDETTGHWQLKVEQRPFDLLIDHLPWGFATIKLPWMPGALHVDWR